MFCLFDSHFVYSCADHPALHSFPTRRSSDLTAEDTQDPLLHEFTSLRAALRMEHVTDGPELLQNMQQIQNQRSEEHTSELQSHSDLVCRLLLEKKKRCRIIFLLYS